MTLAEAKEAGRLAAVLQEARAKRSIVLGMGIDSDLGIDVTFDHCESGNEVVGATPLLVGWDLMTDVLELVEKRLVEQLRQLGVEP